MKILIIEDEPRAANRLSNIILEINSSIEIIKIIPSISEGNSFFSTQPVVDLILSDIQLEDGLSFEIFKKNTIPCPIIFTTAYDQYAIQAFKVNGIDYLLKPIDKEEVRLSLKKFEEHYAKEKTKSLTQEQLLSALAQAVKKEEYKNRFMIKIGTKIKSILIDEIACFYSMNKSNYIQTKKGRSYDLDYTIDQLIDLLDPKKFHQISRKYIISFDAIEEITAWSNSRLKVLILGSTDQDIIVARERTKVFKSWLDG